MHEALSFNTVAAIKMDLCLQLWLIVESVYLQSMDLSGSVPPQKAPRLTTRAVMVLS